MSERWERGLTPTRRADAVIAPITIGPGNAVGMTGVSWRWLRDNAGRLGVPIWRIGGKSMIPAAPLLRALEREAAQQESREPTDEEVRQRLRSQLGMERIPQGPSVGLEAIAEIRGSAIAKSAARG